MSPNLTVGYMAEQINRERLDGIASRGWLAEEAAVTRSRAARPAHVPAMLGTALMRLGDRIHGVAQVAHAPTDHVALPAQ
jgi:hypothetical protein